MRNVAVIEINRGSQCDLTFVWPDGAGDPLNLTGWTLDLFDVSETLTDHVTITATDPAAGAVLIEVDALPDLPVNSTANTFRVRATPPSGADNAITLPQFVIVAR